ncbi:MAG: hypothetical protein ABIJ50_11685 [Pseudomonadota bacterium]
MTKKDKQGALIIIGVSVIFLSLFVLTYRLKASADNYDHETLCRNNGDYQTLKLLIDKTDPWTSQDKKKLAALIRRTKTRLVENERFTIFVLDESGTYSPSPVFDMCNPGRGDQASSLYENPRLVQQRFEENFEAPLDSMLTDLLRPGVAPQSPLLEAIVALKGSGNKERLMIVSDMMQNSEALSFYRRDNNTSSKASIDQICMSPNLYESIEVHVINRPSISGAVRQQTRNLWSHCIDRLTPEHVMTWEVL